MIFTRCIPWRVLALPTPILVLVVTVLPAPLIILSELIKRLCRSMQYRRALGFVRCCGGTIFILYTERPDSTSILEQSVFPQLPIQAVRVHNQTICEKKLRALKGLLPPQLGAAYPILVRYNNNRLDRIVLHQYIYTEQLQVREAADIIQSCKQIIEGM